MMSSGGHHLHPIVCNVRAREGRVGPRRIRHQFAERIGRRLLLWRAEPWRGGCKELRHFGCGVWFWTVGWGRWSGCAVVVRGSEDEGEYTCKLRRGIREVVLDYFN